MIDVPYARQHISDGDVEAVIDVLRSDFLTQGPAVPAFESALAGYCGAAYAVAVSSATSALHLACLALGVGPGDWVWTSPITFVASANCALYCGARVDFVDIDPRTYCVSAERLAEKLEQAAREGRLPKVVIAVHFAGQPCDMATIRALGERFGFTIIEDASHALGGRYRGEPIGGGRYGDITVFSFHAVKLITTGEGGMAVTNDGTLARRMARLRSHGVTRQPDEMANEPHGPWYYEQIELGFNYRLTDIQAALGCSQLTRLDRFVARRREIARRYDEAFRALPVVTPWQHPDGGSAWHLYVLRLMVNDGPAKAGRHVPEAGRHVNHAEVFAALRAAGIRVNLHYLPVYRHPYYARWHYDAAEFPEAERYYAEAISLPMFAGLSDEQQERVIRAVMEACPS